MPSPETFSIPPILSLIQRHIEHPSADPFARRSRLARRCNDIDPEHGCDDQMDAVDFLSTFNDGELATVLFDPPYSGRQVAECYKKLGMTVSQKDTSAHYWGRFKKEISRVVKPGGKVITCGWNSNGIGISRGFSPIEVLIVPHGGWHNDTIVTVEKRVRRDLIW